MKYAYWFIAFILISLVGCSDNRRLGEEIIEKSLVAHGANVMSQSELRFNFRGINYSVARKNGTYSYKRNIMEGSDTIVDILTNDGFERQVNGIKIALEDEEAQRYKSSLNSVIYFSQLPYSLDGKAVNKKHIGNIEIEDRSYHKVKVTFDEHGGGEDHEDVFIYWIDTETFLIDYLAYSFCEEECGYRFRKSYNRRDLNGMIIQDYHNYKTPTIEPELHELDSLFKEDLLIKVSDIELKKAAVTQ